MINLTMSQPARPICRALMRRLRRPTRTYLAHSSGDAINAVLAAVGYNFRRLIQWLRLLMLRILITANFAAQLKPA